MQTTKPSNGVTIIGEVVIITLGKRTADVLSGLACVGSAAMLSHTRLAESAAKLLATYSDLDERMLDLSDLLENYHAIKEATAHAG